MDKWKPDDQQRETLEGLKRESAKEKSNADFARHYLNISPERFSKILAALDENPDRRSYFDEINNANGLMEQLAQKLSSVMIRRMRDAETENVKILPLEKHELIVKAVRQCLKKSSCERLIIFRAPTGGSKTMLCSRLQKDFHARIAYSRLAWSKSYFCFLNDVADVLGLNLGGECRVNIIEDSIINFCMLNAVVLVFDEAEYFGSDALNGIKLLLNKTLITVVINVVPEMHDRWSSKHSMEARQLDRRLHAWFEQKTVSVNDAALFFPNNQFENPKQSLTIIAAAASTFGHFSFINTVAENLEGVKSADESEVTEAINAVLCRMRKPKLEQKKQA